MSDCFVGFFCLLLQPFRRCPNQNQLTMLSETNKRYVSTALLLAFQATWLCEFQVSRGGRSEGFSFFRSALNDERPIRDKDTGYLKTFLLLAKQTAFQIWHTAPICRYSSLVKTARYMKNCAYMLFFSQSLEWPAGHFSSSRKKTGIAHWNLQQPHLRNVWHECHISVCVCFHTWVSAGFESLSTLSSVVVVNSWLTPPATCREAARFWTDPVNHIQI